MDRVRVVVVVQWRMRSVLLSHSLSAPLFFKLLRTGVEMFVYA